MAFTIGSKESNSNGTTPVDIVDAPGAGASRAVTYISVWNPDNATHEVTLSLFNGTIDFIFFQGDVFRDEGFEWDGRLVLDATTKKIRIVLDGAASPELDIIASFAEES